MYIIEESEAFIKYAAENRSGRWTYEAHRRWVLEAHITATLLSAFREAYAIFYEPAWTTHKQATFEAFHFGDIDWHERSDDFDGFNCMVPVETGRLFFPASREALEEAAFNTRSGAFLVGHGDSQIDLIDLVRKTGFEDLHDRIVTPDEYVAFIQVNEWMDAVITSTGRTSDDVNKYVRLAIATWIDPASVLIEDSPPGEDP